MESFVHQHISWSIRFFHPRCCGDEYTTVPVDVMIGLPSCRVVEIWTSTILLCERKKKREGGRERGRQEEERGLRGEGEREHKVFKLWYNIYCITHDSSMPLKHTCTKEKWK